MTALRHAIVDDLCYHLQSSTAWFADNLNILRRSAPGIHRTLNLNEVDRLIAREEAAIAPALATLARAGRHPRYQAADYNEPPPPPNPGTRRPSPSLVDELCDQLEDNLSWPILDAYALREWSVSRDNWNLADAEKQRLANRFQNQLECTHHLLRRCGWTSVAYQHLTNESDAPNSK